MELTEPHDDGACVVCWKAGEKAHLIDRSLRPDPHSDPRRVVRLCREHHEEYDAHELDLLPFLEPRHRCELARAVEIFGLFGTLERVTGQHWLPETDLIQQDIERQMGLTQHTPGCIAGDIDSTCPCEATA